MSCWVLLRIFLRPKVLASVDKAAEDLSAGLRRLWRPGFDPSLIECCFCHPCAVAIGRNFFGVIMVWPWRESQHCG